MIYPANIETIRSWPKDEFGWHRSPEGDDVTLGNRVTLGDYVALDSQPLHLIGSQYPLVLLPDGKLQIGCQCKSVSWWLENGERAAENESFTAAQIAEYRRYVEMIALLRFAQPAEPEAAKLDREGDKLETENRDDRFAQT